MAKGIKTGGRDFKPGVSPNPNGRPPNPPELKAIKQMTKGEFSLLINKLINLKPDELKDFKGTVLEMAMASAMQSAIKHGDFNKIQGFVDRQFGKVSDKVEVKNVDGMTEHEIYLETKSAILEYEERLKKET